VNAAHGTLVITSLPATNLATWKTTLVTAIATAIATGTSVSVDSIASRITVNTITFADGKLTIQFDIASSSDASAPSAAILLSVLAREVSTSGAAATTLQTSISATQLVVTQQDASGNTVQIVSLSSTGTNVSSAARFAVSTFMSLALVVLSVFVIV
jgi:hypothetical protein